MRYLITILAVLFAGFTFAQSFTPTGEYDLHTHVIYFDCNSSEISAEQIEELDKLVYNIISIDAYASVDGNATSNQSLSEARGHAVSSILDFQFTAHGETDQFGSKQANRCVVITYAVLKNNNTPTSVIDTTTMVTNNAPSVDPEGFTCGQRIDPNFYFADTIVAKMELDSPAIVSTKELIILTNVSPSMKGDSLAYTISPVVVDTLFMPVPQAVRFQMQKNGMSRSEAIKSIAARKSQWKELEPKAKAKKAPKKAKAKKMKATRGACRRGLIRFIPNIGC